MSGGDYYVILREIDMLWGQMLISHSILLYISHSEKLRTKKKEEHKDLLIFITFFKIFILFGQNKNGNTEKK